MATMKRYAPGAAVQDVLDVRLAERHDVLAEALIVGAKARRLLVAGRG
jgi:hypothetical protein